MKNGICSKCGGKDVHLEQSPAYRNGLRASFFRPLRLSNYICADCGYVESYVQARYLVSVRENLERVKPVE